MNSYTLGKHFLIRPHPKAPRYNNPEEASLYFQQVISELQSQNGTINEEARELIRQTGYVSLWFFLRFICGAAGPYDKLDDPLDIDMCNFRQSDYWERPGAMAAAFIPRGFRKSTIFTHGGNTWDLLRDPDERILIANAVVDKALEFLAIMARNFTHNEVMEWLYPEYCAKGIDSNAKRLILPNRTRNWVEPSARGIGMTGAAEGGHYTLISIDDLTGLDAVGREKTGTVIMDTAKQWMSTNRVALRVDRTSRTCVVATRYGLDDCYETIYSNCRSITGWRKGDLQPSTEGEWDVYYRLVEEDGIYLRPDVMDAEGMTRLLKDDYWTAMTQYFNAPEKAGLSEFRDATVRICKLRWDPETEEYWIVKEVDSNWDGDAEPTEIRLGSCDVIMSTDFAATDTGITAKTNRSSVGVWAKDSKENCYRIWSRVGFLSIYQVIEYIFEGHRVFGGLIRGTVIETNAFQKVMKVILETEQKLRGEWINPIPVNASGDKFARIRSALGARLPREQIWVTPEAGAEFLAELKIFPMNRNRVDVLDESEKAMSYAVAPISDEERALMEEREDAYMERASWNAIGY